MKVKTACEQCGAEAVREVERREEDGEFNPEYDAFDDVETHVYCTSESEVLA